jgi:four helix bundle protein
MGFAENFEDLQIWQRSRVLTNEIYDAFEKIRDFEFRSQIQRASVSVINNIAEGFERRTKKDFAHFLDLAKGSAGEVRSMLYLSGDRKYITEKSAEQLRSEYKDLSKSIGALASVSVMNNIAEGFERRTKKDFAHFLDLSKGSSGEVRSMLYLAEDRRYLDKSSAEQLRVDYKDLSKSIGALASKLRSQQ